MAYIDLVELGFDPEHAVHGVNAEYWQEWIDQPVAVGKAAHPLELIEPSLRQPLALFGRTVLAVS